jgi:hypothetical protein
MAGRDSRSIHVLSETERKSVIELVEQASREAAVLTALRNNAALRRNAPTVLLGVMVRAGEGMVDATGDVIEAADEITDALEERLPGGIVVNRAFDIALVPGKFGVRVARSVLKVGGQGPVGPNSE